MKHLILTLAVLLSSLFFSSVLYAEECYSDFNCRFGYQCVKPPLGTEGICMKAVDEYKVPTYPQKDPSSIFPNTNLEGDCRFDTDCPIGFRCDWRYKVCIAR